MKKNSGFTLVEISIVIVIIGLVLGGVLVGRDLIQAASLRQSIKQIESFNLAFSNFRLKYNALPGDIHQSKAIQLELSWPTEQYAGTPGSQPYNGYGDGDGIIESGSSGSSQSFSGETLLVFIHLSETGMIQDQLLYNQTLNGDPVIVTENGVLFRDTYGYEAVLKTVLPAFKSDQSNVFIFNYNEVDNNTNRYLLAGIDRIETDGTTSLQAAISPMFGYSLDAKLDDGRPNSGTVTAQAGSRPSSLDISTSAGTATTDCVTADDDSGAYNITIQAAANNLNCHLLVKNLGI